MSLSHTELSQMLETAVVAARLGGQRAMEELRYIRKTLKNNDELVTQADPICQKIIIDRIRETYPDHGFLAEEGKDGKMLWLAPRSEEALWWVIDPIDGTNNFANGLLCFGVSVAVMLDGNPIVGVIFDPATDSMFTAAQDMDTQLNGSKITVSEDEINLFSSFGVDSHSHPDIDAGTEKMMKLTRFRALGTTALHLAYVAKGTLIGMATASSKLWDIAAGTVLIEQAGGLVTTLQGKSPFPIQPEQYKGQPFTIVAANRKTHRQTLEIFAKK